MNPECAGDPSAKNTTDTCGVFVQANSSGSTDAEDGTQGHPYKSLQTAIDKAEGQRVYACGSTTYAESVLVASPVEIYGGFDCKNDWTWTAAARSVLQGAAGKVALTLKKQGDGARVQGFVITAASATAKGGSSIAVVVDDMAAELKDCEVTAGDGMVGEDGIKPAGTATKGTDAPPPDAKTMDACVLPAVVAGGVPGLLTCDDGMTAGGLGGKGGITGTMNGDGAKGADGTPADMVNGLGGAGESMTKCAVGTAGNDGTNGVVGAAGTLPGTLSLMGISDTNMTDGQPGTRGNGGGGGGGAKAGMFCGGGNTDGPGASGGGGGSGGCGGKGGGGGKAGGSSLGIVSLGTKLVLTEVTVTTGNGGDGGKGVSGQGGGAAGLGAVGGAASGGAGSKPGCQGGNGGLGGDGGPGAGGRGGHSLGVAYASGPSQAPLLKGFTGATMGAGGAPGPNNAMATGAKGAAGACWDFSTDKACSP